ncbi:Hint domain-containing protein [Acidisoma cellulosilytica]|uniref:Hint domain-containing protein n=1 Tax=Acidisoma cellulosilyticum TaxID=2802395 RepID=A0A964E684_9PROT|nr:Hint domain-containing protein [Acidisoma cellulosilyticum]MCB8883291.1 Hint domain-containing protein [Acidisoma cellulosilyticum]
MSGTTLDVTLTGSLQAELDQSGVYAYAVLFDSNGFVSETTLVNDGAISSDGSYDITLTDGSDTLDGGKLYVVVQSVDPGTPSTLATDIESQAYINPTNAAADDFGYDSFEVTLLDNGSDAGNLTSVNGFGLPMAVSDVNGSVGYGVSGDTIAADIGSISSDAVSTYSEGALAGDFRMSTSPTESNQADTPADVGAFPQTAWNAYIAALENTATASDILISGQFNGAPDAQGVWHNGGYYAYQLQWDAAEKIFWLVPLADSQIQGYIALTPAEIAQNAYSQIGSVSIYSSDSLDSTLITTMLVGANNQWGAVLAQFLTGFTGGYYGEVGTPQNPQIATPIDLNQNDNWLPDYAFGNHGTSTLDLPAGTQVYDPYSQIFFDNSNSYGSPYSDALMSQYTTGGPLLSMEDPNGGDVSTIDLTVYADGETPGGYTPPTSDTYIAPPAGGYAVPTEQVPGNSLLLNFYSAVADNQGVELDPDATIVLSILTSDTGDVPQWTTVTFDGASSGGLFQSWTLTPDGSGGYSASAGGSSGAPGYMVIAGLPTAASGVSWYQLTVAGADGSDGKTFNLYATTGSSGQIENLDYAGQSGAVVVDGLASVSPTGQTTQYVNNIKLNFSTGSTVAFNPNLAVPVTGTMNNLPTPAAPVVGTLSDGSLTALAGQTAEATNTITTTSDAFGFGWTGYNPAAATITDGAGGPVTGYGWTGTAPVSGSITGSGVITGWVNAYTNKTNGDDTALLTVMNGGSVVGTITALADADGDWLTGQADFGNGTYTVTMADTLDVGGALTPVSAQSGDLVLTVDAADNPTADNSLVVACFAAGTRLATPAGLIAVEDLRPGILVVTADDRVESVQWIGHRDVDCARHPNPRAVWPVRILAGAFGAGMPVRDLYLSPDHAIFAEGALIPVKHLIDGHSIAQMPVETVTYFHVELTGHDVLLAEGLPVESYLDKGDRSSFANTVGAVRLHPAWGADARDLTLFQDAAGYAPLVVTGPVVERLRARLAAGAQVAA